MPDAVIAPAEASTATPEAPVQAPVAANDTPGTFAEQMATWPREARDKWKLTGEE